jgi:hypothetical protein
MTVLVSALVFALAVATDFVLRGANAFLAGAGFLRGAAAFFAAAGGLRVFAAFFTAGWAFRVFDAFLAADFLEADFDAAMFASPARPTSLLPLALLTKCPSS